VPPATAAPPPPQHQAAAPAAAAPAAAAPAPAAAAFVPPRNSSDAYLQVRPQHSVPPPWLPPSHCDTSVRSKADGPKGLSAVT